MSNFGSGTTREDTSICVRLLIRYHRDRPDFNHLDPDGPPIPTSAVQKEISKLGLPYCRNDRIVVPRQGRVQVEWYFPSGSTVPKTIAHKLRPQRGTARAREIDAWFKEFYIYRITVTCKEKGSPPTLIAKHPDDGFSADLGLYPVSGFTNRQLTDGPYKHIPTAPYGLRQSHISEDGTDIQQHPAPTRIWGAPSSNQSSPPTNDTSPAPTRIWGAPFGSQSSNNQSSNNQSSPPTNDISPVKLGRYSILSVRQNGNNDGVLPFAPTPPRSPAATTDDFESSNSSLVPPPTSATVVEDSHSWSNLDRMDTSPRSKLDRYSRSPVRESWRDDSSTSSRKLKRARPRSSSPSSRNLEQRPSTRPRLSLNEEAVARYRDRGDSRSGRHHLSPDPIRFRTGLENANAAASTTSTQSRKSPPTAPRLNRSGLSSSNITHSSRRTASPPSALQTSNNVGNHNNENNHSEESAGSTIELDNLNALISSLREGGVTPSSQEASQEASFNQTNASVAVPNLLSSELDALLKSLPSLTANFPPPVPQAVPSAESNSALNTEQTQRTAASFTPTQMPYGYYPYGYTGYPYPLPHYGMQNPAAVPATPAPGLGAMPPTTSTTNENHVTARTEVVRVKEEAPDNDIIAPESDAKTRREATKRVVQLHSELVSLRKEIRNHGLKQKTILAELSELNEKRKTDFVLGELDDYDLGLDETQLGSGLELGLGHDDDEMLDRPSSSAIETELQSNLLILQAELGSERKKRRAADQERRDAEFAKRAVERALKEAENRCLDAERALKETEQDLRKAEKARKESEHGEREAIDRRREADRMRRDAEKARKDAEYAMREAEDRRKDADFARRELELAFRKLENEKRDAEEWKRAAEQDKKGAESAKREMEKKWQDAETARKEADEKRWEAEAFVADVKREMAAPFIVPALMDAFLNVSKLSTMSGGSMTGATLELHRNGG